MSKRNMFIVGGAVTVVIVAVAVLFLLLGGSGHDHSAKDAAESNILYYTCGMHPSVNISPEEYDKGNKSCPICGMNLVPVLKEENDDENYYGCGMEGEEHVFFLKDAKGMKCPICGMDLVKLTATEADKLRGVAGRVKIKGEQVKLAGAKTEPIQKLTLFKEIQTVGRVAYDSDLAIAEDEYISSLRAYDKIRGGGISEIGKRSAALVESAEKKLKLLGLSDKQIVDLKKSRKVHTNLVLPEAKMWIYGDAYEYELRWLNYGQKIKVTSSAYPGEEFEGIITSINSVLDPKTRSVRFRAEVDNHDLKLKPDMYVDIIIMSDYGKDTDAVLAIPKEAVLDTGRRKIVWFDKGDGLYEGREIVIGPESSTIIDGKSFKYYPVIKGAREGEMVVTKSNFLIDSQSQISGMASSAYGGALGKEDKKGDDDSSETEKTPPPAHQH